MWFQTYSSACRLIVIFIRLIVLLQNVQANTSTKIVIMKDIHDSSAIQVFPFRQSRKLSSDILIFTYIYSYLLFTLIRLRVESFLNDKNMEKRTYYSNLIFTLTCLRSNLAMTSYMATPNNLTVKVFALIFLGGDLALKKILAKIQQGKLKWIYINTHLYRNNL